LVKPISQTMEEIEKSTENKILEAAKDEFIARGFDGARMQKIAERAEINKALLHYYFRNKENLFKAVFGNVFGDFFPGIMKSFLSDLPFTEKLRLFINGYLDVLNANPKLPAFILHEVQHRPELLLDSISSLGIKPQMIAGILENELKKEKLKPIPVPHLIINILSMCIFPIVASPIMAAVFYEGDQKKYLSFLDERKEIIYQFVVNALKS